MAEVIPFCGVHYNSERVPVNEVIAPPYDVLSAAQQDMLYDRHPNNIVRVMLNKETNADTDSENRYTRAAAFLHSWLQEGILQRDSEPAFYEYIQRFDHPLDATRRCERRTLFVALKLEPYENGVVLPHEETHPKAKVDRLNLMRASRANPEPIYGLYEDPAGVMRRSLEQSRGRAGALLYAEAPGAAGGNAEEHILYSHNDPCVNGDLEEFFGPRRIWIADGHHRYETALNYQRERREAEGNPVGAQPYDYLLVGLSAFEDPGLVVLPTHRLIRNVSLERMEALALQLDRYFHVRMMTISEARAWLKAHEEGQKRFAILHKQGAFALTLRSMDLVNSVAPEGHCEAWKALDVTILQSLVLDRTLGISWTALAHTPDVAYTRDEEDAVQKVVDGEYDLACLLQQPTVEEVRQVAAAGDKMPQKSTFFYPKLYSGLILRTL